MTDKQKTLQNMAAYLTDVDDTIKLDLAIILENQKLFNEAAGKDSDFATESLSVVKSAMNRLISWNLISLQSLMSPAGTCYYSDNKEEVAARSIIWPLDGDMEEELINKINREIFNDLINHAGSRLLWDVSMVDGYTIEEKIPDLISVIKKIRQVIKAQSNREEANWLVTSPFVCRLLTLAGLSTNREDFKPKIAEEVGFLLDMRVYCEPKFPATTILMGYKGEGFDSGYFYLPYILLDVLGSQVTTRYAKKMKKGGQNYYAKIMIDNYY